MSDLTQIFVSLLDEGVDVCRPVQAEHLHDNIYRITDQPYDRNTETWQFEPGTEVVCEMTEASDGPIMAAVRSHDS
jgi:hypothetical protein